MLQDTYDSIPIDKSFTELVEVIKKSEKNIYAVLDNNGKFAGIIELNDIKQKLFEPQDFDRTSVKSVMKKPPDVLFDDEPMLSVMEKFDITRSWYLPVLNKDRKFLGFLSKTKLFNKYREILANQGDLYE
jgi:CIC family chloride channel protein